MPANSIQNASFSSDSSNSCNASNTTVTKTHPILQLTELANQWKMDLYSEQFAAELDAKNIWPHNRDKFFYPKLKTLPKVDKTIVQDLEKECIYLCGNSLGLMPKSAPSYVQKEFDKWAEMGVYGHLTGELPWAECNELLRPQISRLVGAKSIEEVNIMNFLSVNLHLMMITFYQPTATRFKILLEEKAFPSDHYVVESQIRLHNLNPADCMVIVKPRENEMTLRTEDIVKTIEEQGDSIALVLLSGVHFFTGQFFDIKEITRASHAKGCYIGWDLAHAVGNVELHMHDWDVDFAAWCTYKYLNAGAGSISGIFLHEKHFDMVKKAKKLDGWWGHRKETRFDMDNKMDYSNGALAYSISNPSMLLCSCLKASLDMFDQVGMATLRKRSLVLTAYLEALLNKHFLDNNMIDYITPTDPEQRGSQLSVRFNKDVLRMHDELEKRGVVADFRAPNVLRFAPTAMYNTFHELYEFVKILVECSKLVYAN